MSGGQGRAVDRMRQIDDGDGGRMGTDRVLAAHTYRGNACNSTAKKFVVIVPLIAGSTSRGMVTTAKLLNHVHSIALRDFYQQESKSTR